MLHSLIGLDAGEALTRAFQRIKEERRQLTAEEIFEQQVSFVFGTMDSSSAVTKAQVRQMLREHQGTRPAN